MGALQLCFPGLDLLEVVEGCTGAEWAERILTRLQKLELKEPCQWERDSYRIAWHTVEAAQRGVDQPWNYAFAVRVGISFKKWQREQIKFLEFHGIRPRMGVFEGTASVPKFSGRIPKKKPQKVLAIG